MSETDRLDVERVLAELPLEQRVGQMMAAGFDGLAAPPYFLDWLREGRLGTVILFARNVASPAQLADLTASLHEASPLPLLIAIDQEGGVVARMVEPFTESPGNMALGAADDPDLARRMAGVMARELRAMGINWNLAPTVDVMSNSQNPAIGLRSYGSDPARVGALGAAQIRGYQEAGVAACAKHFPGHGNTAVDSHVDLPVIQADQAVLDAVDLPPFRAAIAAGVSSIMAAHVHLPAFEARHPATLSRAILHDLLRAELGFTGVATTDCMEMKAVTERYGAGESAVLAALSGVDVIFFSHTQARQAAAYDAVLAAARSGRLPAARITEAVRRILALKACYVGPPAFAPEIIGAPGHGAVALEAARAGLVLLRQAAGVLPLRSDDGQRIALVEFADLRDAGGIHADVAESSGHTRLAAKLSARLPNLEAMALTITPDAAQAQSALDRAAAADLLLLATRNAHLRPPQAELVEQLLAKAPAAILLCLRNPHDAARFPSCQTVLASLGDSSPSLDALVEALLGSLAPTGLLPVAM